MTDITVVNHGTLIALQPITDAGREWIEANLALESWQWLGPCAMIEPRYADAILQGMADDGLEIEA